MEVKIHLAQRMKERNITQAELSDLSGVRQAAISQLSRGFVSRISVDHIERIAEALEITDITQLITLEGAKASEGKA